MSKDRPGIHEFNPWYRKNKTEKTTKNKSRARDLGKWFLPLALRGGRGEAKMFLKQVDELSDKEFVSPRVKPFYLVLKEPGCLQLM